MSSLCPDLKSGNPEDLGAYQRFCGEEGCRSSKSAASPDKAPHIVLIGDDYYTSVEGDQDSGKQWQKVAGLGHLPDELIRAYSEMPKT